MLKLIITNAIAIKDPGNWINTNLRLKRREQVAAPSYYNVEVLLGLLGAEAVVAVAV